MLERSLVGGTICAVLMVALITAEQPDGYAEKEPPGHPWGGPENGEQSHEYPGGWVPDLSERVPIDNVPCNVEIRKRGDITSEEFMRDYVNKKPLIIVDEAKDWKAMTKWTKAALSEHYGNNTFTNLLALGLSGQQLQRPFNAFLEIMKPHEDGVRYTRTSPPPYIFDHNFLMLKPRKKDYQFPSLFEKLNGTFKISYFSIGSTLSGTFWHNHGPAASTTIFGAKRIFAMPESVWDRIAERKAGVGFGRRTDFNTPAGFRHPTEWYNRYYEKYYKGRVKECVCRPGMTFYIPDHWAHGVINVGETVGVAIELKPLPASVTGKERPSHTGQPGSKWTQGGKGESRDVAPPTSNEDGRQWYNVKKPRNPK